VKSAILYMLITVTGQGDVHHSQGYQSLHACEEARSLAVYGETVEQFKKADDDLARAEKEYRDDFYKTHPPRKPKDKDERRYVEEEKELRAKGGYSFGSSWSPCRRGDICGLSMTRDFLIQDEPGPYIGNGFSDSYSSDRGEWVQDVHQRMRIKYPTDVKAAECVRQDK
jgi:hypothetical protein